MRPFLSLLLAECLLSVPAVGTSPAATVAEYDAHTLVVKLAPSHDGKQLARELALSKVAIPRNMGAISNVGGLSMSPAFPIPPRGLKRESLYDSLEMGQYFVVNLTDTVDPMDAMQGLSSRSEFSLVNLNHLSWSNGVSQTPNDPLYAPYQWHYRKIDLPSAWNITTGNNAVLVGTVDSGIDRLHPDLASHIAVNILEASGILGWDDDGNGYVDDYYGWDFIANDGDPEDIFTNGHGTHVAGTIGAVTNNATGVAGVNWNVTLLACRVFDAFGNGATDGRVASAIYFLVNNGAWAINMSLGGPANQPLEYVALNYAYSWNVPVIVSMGNGNAPSTNFPAVHPHVLAVGATDSSDQRWVSSASSGSDYGSNIGVVAPGRAIASTMPFLIEYDTLTGTSMAAPHVTGLAALILSVRPTLTADSVYWYIALGAEDRVGVPAEDIEGPDIYYGWGRINAYNSIRLAQGQCVCKCFGDPNCDHDFSILDVVAVVGEAFRNVPTTTDFGCPAPRMDVNNDGSVTILDVASVVDVTFRNIPMAAKYTDPCE